MLTLHGLADFLKAAFGISGQICPAGICLLLEPDFLSDNSNPLHAGDGRYSLFPVSRHSWFNRVETGEDGGFIARRLPVLTCCLDSMVACQ
jgi:hypothetical protein